MTTYTTKVSYTSNGVLTNYAIPFNYLTKNTVYVYFNGVVQVYGDTYIITDSEVILQGTIPANGVTISIERHTPLAVEDKAVTFTDGSAWTADDLNNNTNQLLYALQELLEVNGSFDVINVGTTNTAVALVTDNLNDIANLEKPKNGRKVFVIYVKNDVVRAYAWIYNSVSVADGVNVIIPNIGGTGRWISTASVNKNQTYFCKTLDELRSLRTAELKLTTEFTNIYAIVFSTDTFIIYKYSAGAGVDDGDTVIVPTEAIGSWLKDTTFTGGGEGGGGSSSQEIYIPATAFYLRYQDTVSKIQNMSVMGFRVVAAELAQSYGVQMAVKLPESYTPANLAKVTIHYIPTALNVDLTLTSKTLKADANNVLTATGLITIGSDTGWEKQVNFAFTPHSAVQLQTKEFTNVDLLVSGTNPKGFLLLDIQNNSADLINIVGISLTL